MKRFAIEKPLMAKRWRREWQLHGGDFGLCHCGAGMGTMRKHKPMESHPSSSCGLCAAIRDGNRHERRQQRYTARAMIDEGLQDS
jgi:hypothetical protein